MSPVRTPLAMAVASLAADRQVIEALPLAVDLFLYAGDDFTLRLDVSDPEGEPLDMTGGEAESHIRADPDAELAGEFAATIDGSALLLHLTGETSAALPASAVWDVEIRLGGQTTTLAGGAITMTAQVTR